MGGMLRAFVPLLLVVVLAALATAQTPQTITIRAGTLLDGRGGSQQNVVVTIREGKIVSVGKSSGGAVTNDLSKYTLLPGFIDMHVHILWHFGADGSYAAGPEAPEARVQAGVANARTT